MGEEKAEGPGKRVALYLPFGVVTALPGASEALSGSKAKARSRLNQRVETVVRQPSGQARRASSSSGYYDTKMVLI
jgi:hypothetical protein